MIELTLQSHKLLGLLWAAYCMQDGLTGVAGAQSCQVNCMLGEAAGQVRSLRNTIKMLMNA